MQDDGNPTFQLFIFIFALLLLLLLLYDVCITPPLELLKLSALW